MSPRLRDIERSETEAGAQRPPSAADIQPRSVTDQYRVIGSFERVGHYLCDPIPG